MLEILSLLILLSRNVITSPISLSGSISADTVLRDANATYYISGDLTIEQSATLTVSPNVTIVLDGNFTLTVLGRLDFLGTPGQPIHLTYTRKYNYLSEPFWNQYFAIYYAFSARPSKIHNLNVVSYIDVDIQYFYSFYLFRVEYFYHDLVNVSIENRAHKSNILFNNLANPGTRTQLNSLRLTNTDMFAYGASNLELINSNMTQSNIHALPHFNEQDTITQLIDKKSLYSIENCTLLFKDQWQSKIKY